ncbi:uncharacterized protein [Antedon mediterranea]|uniref:uncharacterized protein n=1 Tax=Antedon mediterranea TaxID=105859 RepID=UPI003AF6E608
MMFTLFHKTIGHGVRNNVEIMAQMMCMPSLLLATNNRQIIWNVSSENESRRRGRILSGSLAHNVGLHTNCITHFCQKKDADKAVVVNPNHVQWQVFADPTLSETVRQNCVGIERLKSRTESLIEDINDWGFELAKLTDSIETLKKLSLDFSTNNNTNKSDIDYFQEELSKLILNANYANEIAVAQDQEIDDIKVKVEDTFCLLKSVTMNLDQTRDDVDGLFKINNEMRNDIDSIRKEVLEIKSTNNKEINSFRSEIQELQTIVSKDSFTSS